MFARSSLKAYLADCHLEWILLRICHLESLLLR